MAERLFSSSHYEGSRWYRSQERDIRRWRAWAAGHNGHIHFSGSVVQRLSPDSISPFPGWPGSSPGGTMVRMHGPFSGPPTTADLGLSSGPVVVYDGLENGGSNHAIVVSPATHFKGATMLRWGDDWTVGMSGEIASVPAGFKHETILVTGKAGVTEAMDYYGQVMREAHEVKKIPDRVVERLGYWTDNGAFCE